VWQSPSVVQVSLQKPFTQAVPLQSLLVLQLGNVVHAPSWQLQELGHSAVPLQKAPSPSRWMIVQLALNRAGARSNRVLSWGRIFSRLGRPEIG
jgi:hypothetical protein